MAVGVLVALIVGARPRWQWLAAGLGAVVLLALIVLLLWEAARTQYLLLGEQFQLSAAICLLIGLPA